MTVSEYLDLNYTIILKRDEDGDIVARIREWDGCITHGSSIFNALANLGDLQRLWIEMALEHGKEIPLPDKEI